MCIAPRCASLLHSLHLDRVLERARQFVANVFIRRMLCLIVVLEVINQDAYGHATHMLNGVV